MGSSTIMVIFLGPPAGRQVQRRVQTEQTQLEGNKGEKMSFYQAEGDKLQEEALVCKERTQHRKLLCRTLLPQTLLDSFLLPMQVTMLSGTPVDSGMGQGSFPCPEARPGV